MTLLGREVGREEGRNLRNHSIGQLGQPRDPEIPCTQKGLNLGRKTMNAEVVYLLHPEHRFSQKQKARQGHAARRLWSGMTNKCPWTSK